MTSTHKPTHPRYSVLPSLFEILFNIILLDISYGSGIPTHSEKQSSSCWFGKYKGKMNQGLFSQHAKIPPHRKPALPLVFASVQPIRLLSLVRLSGCHLYFIYYALCISFQVFRLVVARCSLSALFVWFS